VLLGDVAVRDVQAATSPANRIAPAKTKSWRFAGDGSGAAGQSRRGKGRVFEWPSEWEADAQQVSGDVAARSHASQRRHRCGIGSPLAAPMSSGFAAASTVVCAAAKNTKSLAEDVTRKHPALQDDCAM